MYVEKQFCPNLNRLLTESTAPAVLKSQSDLYRVSVDFIATQV